MRSHTVRLLIFSMTIVAMVATSLVISVPVGASPPQFANGSGTTQDPYVITSCYELNLVSNYLDDHFIVGADFSCDGPIIGPGEAIGPSSNPVFQSIGSDIEPFEGTLDGQGHTITGVTLEEPDGVCTGTFASTGEDSVIENLSIEGDVIGEESAAIVVGCNEGTLTNVHAFGVLDGDFYVGGLVGISSSTKVISYSSADVDITTTYYSGGLIGAMNSGTVAHSSSSGNLDTKDGFSGGFVGTLDNGDISDCYSTGNLTNALYHSDATGGFVGYMTTSDITRSYSQGDVVSDGSEAGGFVGELYSGEITQSYATGDVTATFQDENQISGEYVGGFAGSVKNDGTITDTYARGNVQATDVAGGHTGNNAGYISRSYSTGTAVSEVSVGGFVAGFHDFDVHSNFWDTQTSGIAESDPTSTGKTTTQMKTIDTYTDLESEGLLDPWDFVGTENDDEGDSEIWAFVAGQNDNYPVFTWQTFDTSSDDDRTASTTETPTGKTVMLHWSEGCDIDAFSVKAESANPTQDVAFQYPNGLAHFTFTGCSVPSINVDLYYLDVTNANFVLRKYMPASHAYVSVTAATLTATTIDGHNAIKASYTIVDNGPLDTNDELGIISDPAGIAQAVLGAPQTGAGGTAEK